MNIGKVGKWVAKVVETASHPSWRSGLTRNRCFDAKKVLALCVRVYTLPPVRRMHVGWLPGDQNSTPYAVDADSNASASAKKKKKLTIDRRFWTCDRPHRHPFFPDTLACTSRHNRRPHRDFSYHASTAKKAGKAKVHTYLRKDSGLIPRFVLRRLYLPILDPSLVVKGEAITQIRTNGSRKRLYASLTSRHQKAGPSPWIGVTNIFLVWN